MILGGLFEFLESRIKKRDIWLGDDEDKLGVFLLGTEIF